ncbi:hypothetical protein [Pseudomonas sp. B21-053]|uniref:hypothetical protein n=1 Tax=Pseudomonas sp. B21-053 TaxID=2895493 RepID=UPI002231F7EA|nr:hypothetical protein [Pseudomonas sp. B21-053]UZE14243.1 hypothetical protein LOY68_11760 [Pseudomonas sp. B21-053]
MGSAWAYFVFGLFAFVVVVVCIVSVVGYLISAIKIIPDYFTSPIQTTLGVYSAQWDGIVQGWNWAKTPMLLAGQFVFAIAGVSAIIVTATLGWAFIARRNKLAVFVSYHHSKLTVMEELISMIGDSRLHFEYLPFVTAPEHDQLLDAIQDRIRQCDMVLCIPGPEPSFVQHEVMAAIHLEKPLIFLVEYNSGRLPNTAQRGYPVFNLKRVQSRRFASVRALMLYLYGDWRSTLKLYQSRHQPAPWVSAFLAVAITPISLVMVSVALLFGLCIPVFVAAWHFLSPNQQGLFLGAFIAGFLCFLTLMVVLLLIILLGNYVSGLVWRRLSNAIVSRRVRTGKFAYEMLQPIFSSKASLIDFGPGAEKDTKEARWLLASLWRNPPRAYHETQKTTRTEPPSMFG